jgi:hypothetical protein
MSGTFELSQKQIGWVVLKPKYNSNAWFLCFLMSEIWVLSNWTWTIPCSKIVAWSWRTLWPWLFYTNGFNLQISTSLFFGHNLLKISIRQKNMRKAILWDQWFKAKIHEHTHGLDLAHTSERELNYNTWHITDGW